MDDWTADVEAILNEEGKFVPVLILCPPTEIGMPVSITLQGAFDTAEEARLAAIDALLERSLGGYI